ncbi:acetyl-CoA carboxylase biotin carboxylase subunit [Kineococcus indalonis]|uniref:acetyl-CoA carboxylase biotin carboxylase subunit n=1 Tax=Kineococcus indalonis TaxID=2696566 RepID=UPI00141362F6|nr:acetyl-CoA carboxylase biotin carboxylase subunit [Kineococcus indalonis]NAZ84799.1 acetyl-CoA carboxylase biotin carboxylase subunit [Kineococcus indalonis]
MFSKVLIANRGEIAVRVARACRSLGVGVVAVHSTADADSAVVRMADQAVNIGPAPSRFSYLNIPNIIEAALQTGADAIHPGYGFLSEDPDFAEVCADNGITFIGPRPDVMARLGNKASARSEMAAAGLPLLPGVVDPVATADEGAAIADDIGYPVVIKAAAGGGGRGITVVRDPAMFRQAYTATRRTAHSVFRDSTVYVERYLDRARHIEVQVLLDEHGGGVHLGERDCSVQRRHQKLVEEAPAAGLSPQQREEIGAAAVRGAQAVGYTGAGTFEFLLDDRGNFSFMEVNCRIQVEHPVTEMVTGLDLVREQILVAAGRPLSFRQEDVRLDGAAVECRINAEDPARGFTPTAGLLDVFDLPGGPGVRVDTGLTAGARISPHYDSLVAKLIAWGPDREQALARMRTALAEMRVEGRGVVTTRDLHLQVLNDPVFQAGQHHTGFLDGATALSA